MKELLQRYEAGCTMNYIGSLGCIFFTDRPVENYSDAKTADTARFAEYFAYMLNHGIHLAPSQFEAIFVSDAHTDETTEETLEVLKNYLESKK